MTENCKFERLDTGGYQCVACGLRAPASAINPTAICGSSPPKPTRQTEPSVLCGTELKSLLKEWLGIESSPTCGCNAMARKMDASGPEWCRSDEGMGQIVAVMRDEHAKRAKDGSTMLPWSDFAARQLVLLACRRAVAKSP